jgi:hypothetical protein
MTSSIVIAVALASVIALPSRVLASPFEPARIPADADGVGHVDMDALRQTVLHRSFLPRINKQADWDDLDPKLRPLLRTLLDTSRGVSFWLTSRDTGAVLIQVPDGRKVQTLLDRVPHRGQVRVGGHVARKYDFSSHGKRDPDDLSLVAVVGNWLVLTDDQRSLARALDAVSGRGRTLAQTRVPDGARERGVFFFTALNDKLLDDVKNAARSATLRLNMSSLTVHVAEVSAEVRIRARLLLGSVEEAQKLKSMVDGIIALASLSDDSDVAKMRRFTRGLRVSANGKALEVSLAMPAAELVKAVESGT